MNIYKEKDLIVHRDIRKKSHHNAIAPLRCLIRGKSTLQNHIKDQIEGKNGAVYIHVPFCKKICTFCNLRRENRLPPEGYEDLLVEQIKNYSRIPYVNNSIYSAVYFGGGTPTILSAQAINKVLKAIRTNLHLSEDVEITFETTVSDLTDDKISVMKEQGVNRFSIGVQTFTEKGRKALGRKGDGEYAAGLIRRLVEQKFDNVGIDLIYNYPGQNENDLEEDLEIISMLDIAGFSFYSLMVHEDSVMGRRIQEGMQNPEENLYEKLFFDRIIERFIDKEFSLLELTKLVKPKRDRYEYVRTRYFGGDTLPIGAGAGGRLGNLSFMNPMDINAYKDFVLLKEDVQGYILNEYYDSIYKIIGQIEFGQFDPKSLEMAFFNKEIVERFYYQLISDGLLEPYGGKYRLTKEGIYWGNNIASKFAEILVGETVSGWWTGKKE